MKTRYIIESPEELHSIMFGHGTSKPYSLRGYKVRIDISGEHPRLVPTDEADASDREELAYVDCDFTSDEFVDYCVRCSKFDVIDPYDEMQEIVDEPITPEPEWNDQRLEEPVTDLEADCPF